MRFSSPSPRVACRLAISLGSNRTAEAAPVAVAGHLDRHRAVSRLDSLGLAAVAAVGSVFFDVGRAASACNSPDRAASSRAFSSGASTPSLPVNSLSPESRRAMACCRNSP